jgi:hypothetical protein
MPSSQPAHVMGSNRGQPLRRTHRIRAVATAFAVFAVLSIATPTVQAAQPTPIAQSTGGPTGGDCFLGICDPATWLQDAVGRILTNVLGGLIGGIGSIPGAIAAFPDDTDFLLRTPEALSYRNDQVQQFVSTTRVLANGLLAVVTLVSGYNVLLRPYLGATYPGALEFVPRLLLGGILANTASWWTTLAIDVNNAACAFFGAGPPPTLDDAFWRASFPTNLLVGLIYVVMGLLLVFQQLMRLALVDVLLVLAPLAALCWILPQSHGWGRLWGNLFIGTVFAQCIQVLALRLGFNLATSIPPLSAAGLVQPLLGIAVLALVLKIPGLMRGGGGGGTLVSSLIGSAAGAVVGGGTGRFVLGALGSAGARSMAARAVTPRPGASQLTLPLSVGVRNGNGNEQLTLPMSVSQSTNHNA